MPTEGCATRRSTCALLRTVVAVADSPYRHDPARIGRVHLDLLAQPSDVHRDGGFVSEGPSPDLLHELGSGEHLTAIGQEVGQQIEFPNGQWRVAAISGYQPSIRVDSQVAVAGR